MTYDTMTHDELIATLRSRDAEIERLGLDLHDARNQLQAAWAQLEAIGAGGVDRRLHTSAETVAAATLLGSMSSPHASGGGPGQPIPMPASAPAALTQGAPSDEEVMDLWAAISGSYNLSSVPGRFARAILARYGAWRAALAHQPSGQAQRDAEDAARYRWLRQHWGRIVDTYHGDSGRIESLTIEPAGSPEGWDVDADSLDAAIDAARKGQGDSNA